MNHTYVLPHFTLDLEALAKFPSASFLEHRAYANLENLDTALKEKFQSKRIGFYDWPNTLTSAEVERIRATAAQIQQRYDGALVFGIGGSYLGAACLQDALATSFFPIQWISNVDRTAVLRAENFARGKKIAAILVSKSGNTTETLSAFYHLSSLIDPQGIFAITDPKSGELRRLATEHGWTSFEVPPNIGGRFSVFTAVGLLPLALAGVDVSLLLKGARELTAFLNASTAQENPAYLFAFFKFLWDQEFNHPIQVLMPYESSLKKIGDWYVQLWAESIGKNQKGMTPLPALGTSDQHSMLQLFKEGPNDKILGFIDVFGKTQTPVGKSPFCSDAFTFLTKHTFEEISHAACLATRTSLMNSAVPTYLVQFPEITPEALGSFLQFQMTACAFAGELYGIDAFNQPGVEEAKRLLREAL